MESQGKEEQSILRVKNRNLLPRIFQFSRARICEKPISRLISNFRTQI
jgi:hypothetical protein